MTYEEFLTKLRETAQLDCYTSEWKEIGEHGIIRAELNWQSVCPITAVFYKETGVIRHPVRAAHCGRMIGLSEDDRQDIIQAADGNVTALKRAAIKQDLCQAVGL